MCIDTIVQSRQLVSEGVVQSAVHCASNPGA
jgi:hypothetical protein